MGIKDTFLFIIFSVNLQKVGTKIVDNAFVVVGAIAVRRDVLANTYAISQFGLQNIRFIQEKNQMDVLQELVRANGGE